MPACRPRVLDLGCGRGGDLLKYRHIGATRVVGVDPSQASVDEARERARAVGVDASFHVGSMLDRLDGHPFDAGSFDLVVCFFSLQYAGGPEAIAQVARTAARLARPDARLVVIVPDCHRVERLAAEDRADQLARVEWMGATTATPVYTFDLVGAIDQCPEYLVESLDLPGWEVEVDCGLGELDRAVGTAPGLRGRMGAVELRHLRPAEREVVELYRLVVARPKSNLSARLLLDANQHGEQDHQHEGERHTEDEWQRGH